MRNNINRYLAWRRVQANVNAMPHEVAAWAMRRCDAQPPRTGCRVGVPMAS